MEALYTAVTMIGEVAEVSVSPNEHSFQLRLLTGDKLTIQVTPTTYYEVLRNIGDESRDRVAEPDEDRVKEAIGSSDDAPDNAMWDTRRKLLKYLQSGMMVCWQGVRSEHGAEAAYSARRIVLMHSAPERYGWEETHWWLQQINTLCEQWLDMLFKERREFEENDFAAFYRTNLDLLGGATDDDIQESATMSRFLYGLSSAYLLTGNERALSAARACATYLVRAYRSNNHNAEYLFWNFGRIKSGKSTKVVIGSKNRDDRGSYALYEQIYVLSGLTQYYRITQDDWILDHIVRTIKAFQKYFLDEISDETPAEGTYTGKGGYFSHLDPVTMRNDSPSLHFPDGGDDYDNRAKKNWNSIGDHIPAYLINLLASIDPLPESSAPGQDKFWTDLRDVCWKILDDCVTNILEHFPPEESSKFVNERFDKDWNPDRTWGWQKDRGIVGHNLKISWNLTRCNRSDPGRVIRNGLRAVRRRRAAARGRRCLDDAGAAPRRYRARANGHVAGKSQ